MIGIRSGYPRISSRVGTKITAYIQLFRPLTLVAPVLGGLAGGLMGYKSIYGVIPGVIDLSLWLPIIFGTVNLLLVQAGNNALNQAAEPELDSLGKPYRPIPRKLISVDEAFGLVLIFYVAASFRSILINETFSTIVFLLIILTVIYSVKPIYLKARLWFGALNLAIARGFLGFLAAYSIYGDPWTPLPLAIGVVLGVYVFGANSTKDYADMDSDLKFGVKTLYTVYGVRTANYFIAPFFIIPYILIIFLVIFQIFPSYFIWMIVLTPVSTLFIRSILRDRTLSIVENSLSWLGFYINLGLLFLGFAVIYFIFP